MNPIRSALVIGCHGNFGRIFAGKLRAAGVQVHGIDQPAAAPPGVLDGQYHQASATTLTGAPLALIGQVDCVMACIPEEAVLKAMPVLDRAMRPGAVVVDVASVKSRIGEAYQRNRCSVGYLSLHPMFAPIEDFTGRAMALVLLQASPASEAFEQMVATWGATLTRLSAEDHDRTMAAIQVLPHAALISFGIALQAGKLPFETIWRLATPIQKTMLGLLLRVAGRDQATHYSIQTDNPHAAGARAALQESIALLSAAVERMPPAAFTDLLGQAAAFIEPADAELRTIADRIVTVTRTADVER